MHTHGLQGYELPLRQHALGSLGAYCVCVCGHAGTCNMGVVSSSVSGQAVKLGSPLAYVSQRHSLVFHCLPNHGPGLAWPSGAALLQ